MPIFKRPAAKIPVTRPTVKKITGTIIPRAIINRIDADELKPIKETIRSAVNKAVNQTRLSVASNVSRVYSKLPELKTPEAVRTEVTTAIKEAAKEAVESTTKTSIFQKAVELVTTKPQNAMIGATVLTGISVAAKSLFGGLTGQARKERVAARKEIKEAQQEAKETVKKQTEQGKKTGAALGNIQNWLRANWQIIAIIAGALGTVYVLYKYVFKKGGRRTSGRRRTGSMAARMARVRAFRKRK